MRQKEKQALQDLIYKELTYKQTRIYVTGVLEEINKFQEKVLKPLEGKVKFIKSFPYEKESLQELIDKKQIDLLIYPYKVAEELNYDPLVREISKILREGQHEVPFIVYKKGRIENDGDLNEINQYPWASIANYPSTLFERVFTYASMKLFTKDRGK